MAEVETQIAALDAAADIRFGFTCACCAHAWEERLDIAAWCWDESRAASAAPVERGASVGERVRLERSADTRA